MQVRQDDLTQACADVMPAVLRWNLGDGLALDKTPRQIVEFMLSLQQMKEVDGNSKADPFCHGCRKLLSLVCFTVIRRLLQCTALNTLKFGCIDTWQRVGPATYFSHFLCNQCHYRHQQTVMETHSAPIALKN